MRHLPRTRSRTAATAGFTLIEVLVALAVVATVLASIGSLAATNMRSARAIEQNQSSVEVARVILGYLPGRDVLAPGNYSGTTAGHRWRVDVVPFTASFVATYSAAGRPLPWIPMRVVVTVQNGGGRALRMETIRLARRGAE